MARMTQGVPTIQIEWIPIVMQEFVVGIPPTWIHLLRRVARAVLFYRETEEATAADDAEDQARSIGIFMNYDPIFCIFIQL